MYIGASNPSTRLIRILAAFICWSFGQFVCLSKSSKWLVTRQWAGGGLAVGTHRRGGNLTVRGVLRLIYGPCRASFTVASAWNCSSVSYPSTVIRTWSNGWRVNAVFVRFFRCCCSCCCCSYISIWARSRVSIKKCLLSLKE